jgi:ABC-type glycerol-3-phosphate transport system substrate-binding protein
MKRLLGIVALALVASTALAACGGDKESPAEAKQNLCASLDDFAASVVALQGVGLSSSQDQIQSALDNIDQAWQQVVADAKDVKTVNTDNIKSTYDDLKQAVQDRPTDQPMTAVIAGLEPKLTAFAQAWKEFAGSLSCKTTS